MLMLLLEACYFSDGFSGIREKQTELLVGSMLRQEQRRMFSFYEEVGKLRAKISKAEKMFSKEGIKVIIESGIDRKEFT